VIGVTRLWGAEPLVEATLERITFANAQTGYTVARVDTERGGDLVTVVGSLLGARPGETLWLRGRWGAHQQYGRQFQVEDYTTVLPAATIELASPHRSSRPCGRTHVGPTGRRSTAANPDEPQPPVEPLDLGQAVDDEGRPGRHFRAGPGDGLRSRPRSPAVPRSRSTYR